jgi:preprotein translocase subunit SecA
MTGTAKTEENEFLNTYNMRVYEIPTNRPVIRTDDPDAIFPDRRQKYEAIVEETMRLHEKGQPVLIGTLSIGINELLSRMLSEKHIPHQVLNARNDADEAAIIARAGQPGAVTVATNMAGRGTDIKLAPGVDKLGGLAVLGSERHESKRIDNQLRGRSGRQGDPGFSRFYCAMDDDLFEEFATEESQELIARYRQGKESAEKMRAMVNRTQERAEGLHFDMRKNTLEYDNVLMEQRHLIYEQRDKVLEMEDPDDLMISILKDDLNEKFQAYEETKDAAKLKKYLMGLHIDPQNFLSESKRKAVEKISAEVMRQFRERTADADQVWLKRSEKITFLRILDRSWRVHVDAMEHLKHSVRLRSYANIKPIDAYKEEAYERFGNMTANIREQMISALVSTGRREEQADD